MVLKSLTKHLSKPEGVVGKLCLQLMNKGHAPGEEWALKNIKCQNNSIILDIGCGGGLNIRNLAKLDPSLTIYGMDYSSTAVKESRNFNKKFINEGRVSIVEACVSNIPYENDKFDLITAFETVYFWPEILKSFKEVRRTLKKNGLFYIFLEAGNENSMEYWSKKVPNMTSYKIEELISLLKEAGFSCTLTKKHNIKPWVLIEVKN